MGQSPGTQNQSARSVEDVSGEKKPSRCQRSKPGRKSRGVRAEREQDAEWFHGDDCIPTIAAVLELESSESNDEGEYGSPGDSRKGAWKRWRGDCPGRSPSGASEKSEHDYGGRPVATFRTVPPAPKRLARPTSVEEVYCYNLLMSECDRTKMELANRWSSVHHSPNISLLPEKPLTFHRKPIAQSTDAVRTAQGYSKGVHVFEVCWPVSQRGTHPLVGKYRQQSYFITPPVFSIIIRVGCV